jgi:F-type H+-transporting ATPase subunit b
MIIDTAYAAETASHTEATTEVAGASGGGIQSLGIDAKLLAAQIINFVILLLILRQFVYKPLMAILEKRRLDIERSLKQAEETEHRSQAMQVEHVQQIEKTKAEATAIIEKAKQAAEVMRVEMLEASRQESEKILARAQEEISRQKDKMLSEAKQDIGALVIAATEKIISKEIDASVQERLVAEAINGLKK